MLEDEMSKRLHRSVKLPIREGLSWEQRWRGSDNGLIACWERGREVQAERPEDAARAKRGELIMLPWKGGVLKKLKADRVPGTLNYLAMWQGIRGEDLDIDLEGERIIVSSRTGQAVMFSAKLPENAEEVWVAAGR
jgi:hypothetical protein